MGDGNDNNSGGREEAPRLSKGKKDDSDSSPQSVHQPLRHQQSPEGLLPLINEGGGGELGMEVQREPNTMALDKNASKDNSHSTGVQREMNRMTPTDNIYSELSEQEQSILRQHVSQNPLPQMKTPIAIDIRMRIILWGMKAPFKKVPPGYAHTSGKIIPSQRDKEEFQAAERQLWKRREWWKKERMNAVRLPTMLERTEEEEIAEAMEGLEIRRAL